MGWLKPSELQRPGSSKPILRIFGDRPWIQPWIPRGAASDINGISIPDRLDRCVLHRVRDFSEYLMDFGQYRKKDSYQFPACLLPAATILAPALCQKVNVIKGTSVAQPAASGRLLSLHLAFRETQTRHTRLPWFNEVRLWMSNMTRAAKYLGLCRLLDSSLSIGVEQFFLKLIASHKVRFITSNKRRYYEIMKALWKHSSRAVQGPQHFQTGPVHMETPTPDQLACMQAGSQHKPDFLDLHVDYIHIWVCQQLWLCWRQCGPLGVPDPTEAINTVHQCWIVLC